MIKILVTIIIAMGGKDVLCVDPSVMFISIAV